jgi:large subunit ribosomal protein L21e
MAHHNGQKKKTRYKYKKDLRERGMAPVTAAIQEFEPGQRVHIVVNPSVQTGMPHRRFHGRTGVIVGKQGRAWVLEIADGNLTKTVVSLPQHLRAQRL